MCLCARMWWAAVRWGVRSECRRGFLFPGQGHLPTTQPSLSLCSLVACGAPHYHLWHRVPASLTGYLPWALRTQACFNLYSLWKEIWCQLAGIGSAIWDAKVLRRDEMPGRILCQNMKATGLRIHIESVAQFSKPLRAPVIVFPWIRGTLALGLLSTPAFHF